MNIEHLTGQAISWAVAIALAVWSYVRAHRDQLSRYADIAIGIVQKYLADAPEKEMEDEAIRVVYSLWPGLRKRKPLTEFLVRAAVRKACERRKFLGAYVGLRGTKARAAK